MGFPMLDEYGSLASSEVEDFGTESEDKHSPKEIRQNLAYTNHFKLPPYYTLPAYLEPPIKRFEGKLPGINDSNESQDSEPYGPYLAITEPPEEHPPALEM